MMNKFTLLICLLFALSIITKAQSEKKVTVKVDPISAGDTVPEQIWQMPFQVVKYGEKVKTVKLADYRGKIIILDYWATWCASCILSIPKMHGLAAAFPKDVVLLPVTYEEGSLIESFLKKTASPQIRKYEKEFATIVDGQVLKDLVPHRTLPHLAIINADGVLERSTKNVFINEEILSKMVLKEDYYMPEYLDESKEILTPTFPNARAVTPIYYTALLSGLMENFITPRMKPQFDTIAQTIKGTIINSSILFLYNEAFNNGLARRSNRRIMIMKDPSIYDQERNPDLKFKDQRYSWEFVLPIDWRNPDHNGLSERMRGKLLDDLNYYSALYGQTIERMMPCLIIRSTNRTIPESQYNERGIRYVKNGVSQTRVPETVGLSPFGAKNYLLGSRMQTLVYFLNNLKETSIPFVIDETGIDYRIDLDLPDDLGDIEALKKVLFKQGLEVTVESRKLEMVVMSDQGPIDEATLLSSPLELTKFGYTVSEAHSSATAN